MESDALSSSSLYDVRAQNPGKTDSEIREIYVYGAGLQSIRCIVGLPRFSNLQFLSLHNNEIKRIEGLETLTSLKELNLSSNNISTIEGLSTLSNLKILNLSCNRISEIVGLEGLFSLNKLILSHNYIKKLSGISALHGPRCTLKYLDLRDNLVKSLAELWQLAGCIHLEELLFFQGKYSNPVCQEGTYYATVAAALPHLKYLDGEPLPIPDLQPLSSKPMVVSTQHSNTSSIPTAKGPFRKKNLQPVSRTVNAEYENRLGVLESRLSFLLEKMKSLSEHRKDNQASSKGSSPSPGKENLGSLTLQERIPTFPNPEYESRLGALEARLSDILENLQNTKDKQAKTEDANMKEHQPSPQSPRKEIENALKEKILTEYDGRLEGLETRFACLQEKMKSPSPNPGKEDLQSLEKTLKKKDAYIQELLSKVEKCPPALSIKEQIKVEILSLQSENVALKDALNVANCLRQNAERALMDVTAEKENLRQSVSSMTKHLDDEHAKLKICHTELESCKRKELLAHDEVRRLSSLLATERAERKKEIENLTSIHERNLRAAVDGESRAAELRGRSEAESMLGTLQAKLQSTERELQLAIEEKRKCTERVEKVKEESSQENAELRQALKTVVQKEQDAEALVAELTAIVHSQKLKLQATQLEICASSEELQSLRLEASTLKKEAAKCDSLVENLRQQLLEASKAGERERRKQEVSCNAQVESLKEEIGRLSNQLATTSEKLQASDDAVRVKSKMLDSQNETIKDLKLELARTKDALKEAKSSADSVENEWNARFRDEVEQGRALRKELAAQDVVISELEEELKAQKAACLTAGHEYSTLKQKIKEKDELLRYVEGEIGQVKSLYENREKTITSERDQAVEKLELAILEKRNAEAKASEAQRQMDQLNAANIELENKEREVSSILKLKNEELEESSRRILQLEGELKELERQKASSSCKLNKLSKVLEELRAAS